MKDIILEKIAEIEKSENVKIIHCVESGSRAWGFASPDSDYDVRFIYARPKDFYLKLEKTRDVIEWQLDDVLDINGWDLQKALRLLHKSNPTLFEWNSSPIVYKTTPQWQEVQKIIDEYFLNEVEIYHYLSTARRNYSEFLLGKQVKFKKYFYVLRPILACKWIIDKGTPPPMLFSELCDSQLEEDMREPVFKLIELKKNTPEIGTGDRIDILNKYIERQFSFIKKNIPHDTHNPDWDKLNDVFLKIVE